MHVQVNLALEELQSAVENVTSFHQPTDVHTKCLYFNTIMISLLRLKKESEEEEKEEQREEGVCFSLTSFQRTIRQLRIPFSPS